MSAERPSPSPSEIPSRPEASETYGDIEARLMRNLGMNENDISSHNRGSNRRSTSRRQPQTTRKPAGVISDPGKANFVASAATSSNEIVIDPQLLHDAIEDQAPTAAPERQIDESAVGHTLRLEQVDQAWESHGQYGGKVTLDRDALFSDAPTPRVTPEVNTVHDVPVPDEVVDPNGVDKLEELFAQEASAPAAQEEATTEAVLDAAPEASAAKATPERKKSPLKWLKRVGAAALINFRIAKQIGFKEFAAEKFDAAKEKFIGSAGERYRKTIDTIGNKMNDSMNNLTSKRETALHRKAVRKEAFARLVNIKAQEFKNDARSRKLQNNPSFAKPAL